MQYLIIYTTCKNKKQAFKIAKKLIKNKLSSCVQMSKISSHYIYNKKVFSEKEILLSIKTCKKLYKKIKKKIKKNHSYKTPEILCVDIRNIEKAYKQWMIDSLEK